MTTEFLVLMFLKAQVAASCAILLVVALRLPVRRLFGAEIGYNLWFLVPVAALASLFVVGQCRFDRSARAGRAGPAATGFWPRMIVPVEYARRFTLEERALIRAHERTHMDRRDPTSNLMI